MYYKYRNQSVTEGFQFSNNSLRNYIVLFLAIAFIVFLIFYYRKKSQNDKQNFGFRFY